MKIQISKLISGNSGPGISTRRIISALVEHHGVRLVTSRADILFCAIYVDDNIPAGVKKVVRIDGIYWDNERFRRNKKIFKGIKKADGVVFQSEFSKKCYQAHLGEIRNSTVILNGINQDRVNNIPPAQIESGMISCADWRPIKRPNSICNGYIESGVEIPLYMVGNFPKTGMVNHPRIKWVGEVGPDQVISMMKACSHAIHIAKFDACPNTVVEEMSCGLPVLSSDNGGTPELVKNDGVYISTDAGWNFLPMSMGNPDNIPSNIVADGIRQLVGMPRIERRPDLDLKNVAAQYYSYFSKILS